MARPRTRSQRARPDLPPDSPWNRSRRKPGNGTRPRLSGGWALLGVVAVLVLGLGAARLSGAVGGTRSGAPRTPPAVASSTTQSPSVVRLPGGREITLAPAPPGPPPLLIAGTVGHSPTAPSQVVDDGSGQPWTGDGLARRATGKVYATTLPDSLFGGTRIPVCTATSVGSSSGLVIALAAHCINDPSLIDHVKPQDVAYWDFVPSASGPDGSPSSEPFGRWRVDKVVNNPQYANTDFGSRIHQDMAFMRVQPRAGQTLAQVVGAVDIEFNPAPAAGVLILGYPNDQRPPGADGTTLRSCSGTGPAVPNLRDLNGGSNRVACAMGQGASGGPWLEHFDASTGTGTLVGVTAGGEIVDDAALSPGVMTSDIALDLYRAADR